MVLKRRIHNPQGYIQAGMVFFLIGIFTSMVADGRLVGHFLIDLIPTASLANTIQGFADGFSLPMLMASIFFSLRGLAMQRSG